MVDFHICISVPLKQIYFSLAKHLESKWFIIEWKFI